MIEADAAQRAIVARLDALADALGDYRLPDKSGALSWLFSGRKTEVPHGLYIWGSVGRGKTMLMDLFFESATVRRKRRVHFHAFMADVHVRIHEWRQAHKRGEVKGDDPVEPVAADLAQQAALLCFDEFAVNDIADAMILGRLFKALFARGVVVVATSNVEPHDLYRDGLNRALFLPFIAMLAERMDILRLDARTDFRLEKLSGSSVWHVPADANARAELDKAFDRLSGGAKGKPATLRILGRDLPVPRAAGGIARFSFADLCLQPRGANDFLAIARAYGVVILDDVPCIDPAQRNEVRRFITLIDALYDQNVKLIASADAEPADLYKGESGRETFEFARTVSRLIEMRSDDYLSLAHRHSLSLGSGDSTGLVDT